MNVTPDQLLTEIGRLHVANQVLTEQLAASRLEVARLSGELATHCDGLEPENPENEL